MQSCWKRFLAHVQRLSQNYGGARRTLCLIDSGVNGNQSAYCPLEILNNVKSAGMEISYGSIKQLVQNPMENLKKLVNTTLCQPCGKGAVAGLINLLNNLDGAWATSVADTVDQYCGGAWLRSRRIVDAMIRKPG